MNEGYALFDKVVSVLENANMFQSVRDTVNVIEATTNVTVDLDTYGYGSTAKNYTGTIIAVKLLGGGVLRNLVARPRKAVVA